MTLDQHTMRLAHLMIVRARVLRTIGKLKALPELNEFQTKYLARLEQRKLVLSDQWFELFWDVPIKMERRHPERLFAA